MIYGHNNELGFVPSPPYRTEGKRLLKYVTTICYKLYNVQCGFKKKKNLGTNTFVNVVAVELHSHDIYNSEPRKIEKKMPSLSSKYRKIPHI